MIKRFFVTFVLTFLVLSGVGGGIYEYHHRHDAPAVSTAKRADISITIVEGKRREEIAAALSAAGITGYDDFMTESANYEGMLFPDTYRFFPDTPAKDVVAKLNNDYLEKTLNLDVSGDTLTLASIVEREAATDAERPIIAGVYANRIAIGMNLEADPTVQYAKDAQAYAASKTPETYEFWKPITQADYHSVNSQFNTYVTNGLPPSPICNPGLKSIEAALNPAQHKYYYFFQRNGQLYLSKTLQEHLAKLASVPK